MQMDAHLKWFPVLLAGQYQCSVPQIWFSTRKSKSASILRMYLVMLRSRRIQVLLNQRSFRKWVFLDVLGRCEAEGKTAQGPCSKTFTNCVEGKVGRIHLFNMCYCFRMLFSGVQSNVWRWLRFLWNTWNLLGTVQDTRVFKPNEAILIQIFFIEFNACSDNRWIKFFNVEGCSCSARRENGALDIPLVYCLVQWSALDSKQVEWSYPGCKEWWIEMKCEILSVGQGDALGSDQ